MSSSPYQQCMRNASVILFAISFLVVLAGVIHAIVVASMTVFSFGYVEQGASRAIVFSTLIAAFNNGALPFFGAAFLNRFDKWLEAKQ